MRTPTPNAAAPLQGGLTNPELSAAWGKKLPGITPSDRDLTAFALGIEVGQAHARDLERQDWSRVHHVLAKHGVHPGRTDDHLADVIDAALAQQVPAVPAGWRLVPVEPTQAMLEEMDSSGWLPGCYRRMLAAAPLPTPEKPA